jgi:hypothetical protein
MIDHNTPVKYWPFFCEENIWHLCQEKFLRPFERKVVFVSNTNRSVAMKFQKAVPPNTTVTWDYHVILLFRDAEWKVADLDTRLSLPCSCQEYFSNSFMPAQTPTFRVVDADDFIIHFASDRRHMENQPQAPPPWDNIGTGFNLWDFVSVSNNSYGQIYNLKEMFKEFGKK